MIDFSTAFLTAGDGTPIGYRQIGEGPGLILVHGGLQSSLNFTTLAKALSANFTVYVPDRRGRGLSGDYGDTDDRITEAKDILALAQATDTSQVFGLSSGAIITLQAALLEPTIQKIALYEPPIPLHKNTFNKLDTAYEGAMNMGNLGRAFAAILKGTGDTSLFSRLPYFILTPLLNFLINKQVKIEGKIALRDLVPTYHHDLIVVHGAKQLIDEARNVKAEVLLLHGAKSQDFLKHPLDKLAAAIARTQRVEFKKQGHLAADNSGDPLRVAATLKHFFNSTVVPV